MSTEFISMLPPPGKNVAAYDSTLPHDRQVASIPSVFVEAMSVREDVYVHEQRVPLQNEFDIDDHRSFHWVTYVSVGTTSSSASTPASGQKRNSSTASRLPVATIRLVPPPHPPHPHPYAAEHTPNQNTRSPFNPGNEPFVKIGRLATLRTYRGLGLARLLVETALDWAAAHPGQVHGPERRPSVVGREAAHLEAGAGIHHNSSVSAGHGRSRSGSSASGAGAPGSPGADGADVDEPWQGLVLVHAQVHLEKFWAAFGFARDETLGVWIEEGIEHIGMWKRLDVTKR